MKDDYLSKNYHSRYFSVALSDNISELEVVYGIDRSKKLNKLDFIRLLNILRHKYESIGESNTLDITKQIITLKNIYLSNIRCTIEGIKNIQEYCKNNKIGEIKDVQYLEKKNYINSKIPDADYSSVINYDYNFKMNLKSEEELYNSYGVIINYLEDFDKSEKYFRYKKRYSFITDDKLFRIDLTAVKTSDWDNSKRKYKCYRSFLESNILKNEETYELEIEYIGSNEKVDTKTNEKLSPIDDFIEKLSENMVKRYHSQNEYHQNEYSELQYIEKTKEKKQKDEYKYDSEDEFEDDYTDRLFPVTFTPITSDPLSDIMIDYWIMSDKEWLYDTLFNYEKKLLYEKIEKNVKGDYLNSEEGDYVIYHISPSFTDEEKEEIKDFPEDFSNRLMIPLNMILNTSERYEKEEIITEKLVTEPTWGPKKKEKRIAFCSKTNDFEKIEKILDKRKVKKGVTMEYLIRWENKDKTHDEWKTEGELPDAQKMIKEYNNSLEKYKLSEQSKKRREVYNSEIIDPGVAAEIIRLEEGYPLSTTSEKTIIRRSKLVIDNVISNLNDIIYELLKCIHNTDKIIPRRKMDDILQTYHSLTEQMDYTKEKQELEKLNEMIKKEKNYAKIKDYKYKIYQIQKKIKPTRFVGPQPVSMSKDCLMPDNPHSILSGYVVTEKADGVRAQLLIQSKNGYLITSKLDVIDTCVKYENCKGLWLFDGEYITKNINNEDIKLFMIFDVYYAGDGDSETYPNHAYTYPWLSRDKKDISRSLIIHDYRSRVNMIGEDGSIKIDFKNYLEGPKELKRDKKNPKIYTNITSMGKQSKKILDIAKKRDDGYEYEIDGLIYLPMFLSVKSMNEGEIENNIGGTWSINYKWKPPEENTIDFRVKIVKQGKKDKITTITENGEVIQCKEVDLYVDYKIFDDEEYDFCRELLKSEKDNSIFNKNEILFLRDKDISTTKIKLKNGKMLCCKDKVEIVHNMIVEMRFLGLDKEIKWEPLRFRKDKNNRAQYFKIANNIWDTINEPVLESLITGKDKEGLYNIKKIEKIDNYYVGGLDMKSDKSLREFHNYIKSKLIEYVCSVGNKPISIMDTSIGQGGDIQKYLRSKNRINFLFGLDIYPDINRAAKRFYFEKMRKPKALFMQYDTGEIISEKSGLIGDNIEINTQLIDILYEKNRNISKQYKSYEKKYSGLGKKGFNIISSQFSFHYYCKDEKSLRNYIYNLSENCKTGGFFIGTCYDGKKVFDLLKDKEIIEMKDEFGNLVYSITKDYSIDTFQYSKGDPENNLSLLGNKIDVYMNSIGQKIKEYLVNFEYIIKIMKEYDFELYDCKEKGLLNKSKYHYLPGMGGFELILKDLRSIEDKMLREFYSETYELLKKENQGLVNLISLNNWFIFQKK